MVAPKPELKPRRESRAGGGPLPLIIGLGSAVVVSLLLWALFAVAGAALWDLFTGAREAA